MFGPMFALELVSIVNDPVMILVVKANNGKLNNITSINKIIPVTYLNKLILF